MAFLQERELVLLGFPVASLPNPTDEEEVQQLPLMGLVDFITSTKLKLILLYLFICFKYINGYL